MRITVVINDNPALFQTIVNQHLAAGWRIRDGGPRQVGPQTWKLYAMLELPEPGQTADPVLEAMRVVHKACREQGRCLGCAYHRYCLTEPPADWRMPE